jgi:hypothetical protein
MVYLDVFFACTFYATSYAFTAMFEGGGWRLVSYCSLERAVVGCKEDKKNRHIKTFEKIEKSRFGFK